MSEIKLDVDLSSGKFCVVCPETALDTVFEKLETFLPKLLTLQSPVPKKDSDQRPEVNPGATEKHDSGETRVRKTNGRKKSGYSTVDFGLSSEQEREFKKFYDSKKPKTQNDQILTVIYWLQANLNRNVFDQDDIFTGLRTVGAKIPARIDSVAANLIIDGKMVNPERGKYKLNHIGEDRVDKELPLAEAAKA